MLLPKIVYGSGPTTLNFTFPPVNKPGTDELKAERTDTITSTGLKQSVFERTDTFKTLQMDYVPAADLANWAAFIAYAIEGGEFEYYPDATISGTHATYTLEDTDWKPQRNFRGYAKFTLVLRKKI